MADPSSATERYDPPFERLVLPPFQRNQPDRPTSGDDSNQPLADQTRSHETNVDDSNQPLADQTRSHETNVNDSNQPLVDQARSHETNVDDSNKSLADQTRSHETNVDDSNQPLADQTRSHETNVDDSNQPLAAGESSSRPTTLNNFSRSEAYQLLSERWAAALREYNNPTVDSSERPLMHYGGYVWGKLPHQIIASRNNTLPTSMSLEDYTKELQRGLLTPKFSNIIKK